MAQSTILDTYRARRKPGTVGELQSELRRLEIPTNGLAPVVRILDQSRTEVQTRPRRRQFASAD